MVCTARSREDGVDRPAGDEIRPVGKALFPPPELIDQDPTPRQETIGTRFLSREVPEFSRILA